MTRIVTTIITMIIVNSSGIKDTPIKAPTNKLTTNKQHQLH